MALNKSQIRGSNDIKTARVSVPEWADEGANPDDAYVIVRTLSGRERVLLELMQEDKSKTKTDILVFGVIASCVDDDGNKIFDDSDAPWLIEKSGDVLVRVFMRVAELSGLNQKSIQTAKKNSPDGQSDNSGSD